MQNPIRYCWMMPDFTFSSSWSQEEHDRIIDPYMLRVAKEKGWRIMKYVIDHGNDFELPNQSFLAQNNKGNFKRKK